MPPKSPKGAKAKEQEVKEAAKEQVPELVATAPEQAVEDSQPLATARYVVRTPRVHGVTMASLMQFVFPPHKEHPESTGRLELFARYGPCDEEGGLLGGRSGWHKHQDWEIRQMIINSTREVLFSVMKKPREDVEALVDSLLPTTLEENYSRVEVQKLLRGIPLDDDGKMPFNLIQDLVLQKQRTRLKTVISGFYQRKERGPKVPFQNKQSAASMAITFKKKLTDAEGNHAQARRLQKYSTTLGALEEQNRMSAHITNNVRLCRHLGDCNDKWDRYCSVRRTGRSGYVRAKNGPRLCLDDGLGDKHPGCSSLVSAGVISAANSLI